MTLITPQRLMVTIHVKIVLMHLNWISDTTMIYDNDFQSSKNKCRWNYVKNQGSNILSIPGVLNCRNMVPIGTFTIWFKFFYKIQTWVKFSEARRSGFWIKIKRIWCRTTVLLFWLLRMIIITLHLKWQSFKNPIGKCICCQGSDLEYGYERFSNW